MKVKGGASQTYVVDTMKMKKTTTVSGERMVNFVHEGCPWEEDKEREW